MVFEEMWQEYRKYHIGLGNGDPGRPDYYFGQNVSMEIATWPVSHSSHQMMTSYEVHWGMFAPDHVVRSSGPGQVTVYIGIRDCPGHDPPVPHQLSFPKLDLLVAIPNVVFACLPRLASFPSRIPLQQKLLRIGAYLVDLWNWDPHIPAIDGRPQYLRVAVSNGDVPQWPPPPSRVLGTPLNQDSIYGHYISPPVTPGYQLARVPMTSAFELPLPQPSPLNSLARTQHPTCMPLTPPESPTKNHLDIPLHENQLVPHSMLPMPPGPLHYASSAMSMSHSHALFMSRTLSTSPVHLAASFLGNESVSTNDKNTSQISREETFARIQTWRKAVVDCDTKVLSIEETVPERSFGRHTTANDILFMIGVMKGSSWLKGLSVPVT